MNLEKTEEELQKSEHLRREKRQRLEDLAQVLKKPEGQRLMLGLLRRLGAASPANAENMALRNFGLGLLREMQAASPGATRDIVASLLGGE